MLLFAGVGRRNFVGFNLCCKRLAVLAFVLTRLLEAFQDLRLGFFRIVLHVVLGEVLCLEVLVDGFAVFVANFLLVFAVDVTDVAPLRLDGFLEALIGIRLQRTSLSRTC